MNHSGLTVTMSREVNDDTLALRQMLNPDACHLNLCDCAPCDKCGGRVHVGYWPWCNGNPIDHLR